MPSRSGTKWPGLWRLEFRCNLFHAGGDNHHAEVRLRRGQVGESKDRTERSPTCPQPTAKSPIPRRGIKVYPTTGSATTRAPIEYKRKPPTNGIHDPLWQNRGYFSNPIEDRHAVHSLNHLQARPASTSDRDAAPYGDESYVIVSPYPGQSAPLTVTPWHVQLKLQSASDQRLRKFVDQFRRSELAPLWGIAAFSASLSRSTPGRRYVLRR